jgi:pSer/pThr/pTyr-binding forkhead associated (FHA) protein
MAVLEVWDARGCSFCSLTGAELVIGRASDCHLVLGEDDAVSRKHAAVTLIGGVWIIHDLGSRNGTWVNGSRVNGQRALHHSDTVNIGRARLVFRDSRSENVGPSTSPITERPSLTPAQHRTLLELVRPILVPDRPAPGPATVRDIAARLYVGEGAVKANLAALYDKFGVDPTDVKDRRLRLANEAIRRCAVRVEDLQTST